MPTNGNVFKQAGKGDDDRGDAKALRKRRNNDAYWNNTSFHKARKEVDKQKK